MWFRCQPKWLEYNNREVVLSSGPESQARNSIPLPLPTPSAENPLLLGLEVVQEDGSLLRLLTPVLNNDARAVDDLAGVALTVEDA